MPFPDFTTGDAASEAMNSMLPTDARELKMEIALEILARRHDTPKTAEQVNADLWL